MLTAPEWVGLGNYERLAADEFARQALRNTAVFTAGMVFLGIPAGLGLALLANAPLPGIRLIRLAYIVPYVSSTVAIALVWQWILNGKLGLLNQFLKMLGIEGQSWLVNPDIAMFSVIVVSVWQSVGYKMLLFLAGLQSIPESLYEAAKIDGGGVRSRFWHITLPLAVAYHILRPDHHLDQFLSSLQHHLHLYLYQWRRGTHTFAGCLGLLPLADRLSPSIAPGYAAAMAFGLFLVIAFVTFIQWRASKLWVFYGE